MTGRIRFSFKSQTQEDDLPHKPVSGNDQRGDRQVDDNQLLGRCQHYINQHQVQTAFNIAMHIRDAVIKTAALTAVSNAFMAEGSIQRAWDVVRFFPHQEQDTVGNQYRHLQALYNERMPPQQPSDTALYFPF